MLPLETSVFSGKCVGLLKAVEYILLAKLHKAIIFSYSKGALQSLCKYRFKSGKFSPIICQIREALYKCHTKSLNVLFVWIPGHSDVPPRGVLALSWRGL